jgi:hypothetical protein
MAVTINTSTAGGGSGAPGPAGPPGPPGAGFISKSGFVAAGSFAGNPKKATVTFGAPYASTNYSVVFGGIDARDITYESKATTGFVINLNANTAPTGELSWFTAPIGEVV